jgi:4-aminobutyrate aminotransferase
LVVCHGSFHGRTVGAASMTTSGTKIRAGFGPLMGGVAVAPFPQAFRYGWDEETATRFALQELDYLLATVSAPQDTAAFVVEPMLGEGGYIPATPGILEGLRERADRHGILLVVDEVQTGWGRTGRFWGHDHFGVQPDVLITAKGLASGFPLSGIAASSELMAKAWPGSQGGTYGGNAVSCAAALATLDVIEDEGLVERAEHLGRRLLDGVRTAARGHDRVAEVRGRGLMVGIELAEPGTLQPRPDLAKGLLSEAQRRDLLLLTCGTHSQTVRIIPPLVTTDDEIDLAAGTIGEALGAVGA